MDFASVVTGRLMPVADILEGRTEFAADIGGETAARSEGATGGKVRRIGRNAFNGDNALRGSIKAGDRVQKTKGIGMVRTVVDRRGRTDLDGAAGVHD